MAKLLKALAYLMGYAIVAIGVYHFVFGEYSVPGAGPATPTIDSRERFYSAIFLGYGLAWVWVARQRPIPATMIRILTGIFLLGGIGRVISLVQLGWPHWLQNAEGAVELLFPVVFFLLAAADEKASRAAPVARTPATAPR